MTEQIAQAYVRIRPDLAGFKGELQSQLKGELGGVSTLKLPETATHTRLVGVLGQERVALAATGKAAAAASAEQVAASRISLASVGKAERGALAASGAFRGMGRSVAFASAAFLGGFGFVAVLRSAIEEATQLETALNATPVIFGRSSVAAEEFASSAYQSLGLAKSTALEAVDAFGRLFRGIGLAPAQAEALSESLAKVGAAISISRGEEDPAAADRAIIGGLAGRGAALKRYGIIIDQTTLKAEALRLGLVASSKVDPVKVEVALRRLSEAQAALHVQQSKAAPDALAISKAQTAIIVSHNALEKALAGEEVALTRTVRTQAATSLIVAQGARYVKDYANALDSTAGRQRKFTEGSKELREEFGTLLLPAFNAALGTVNEWIAAVSEGGEHHDEFVGALHSVGTAANDAWKALSITGQVLRELAVPLGGVKNVLEVLATLWAVNKVLAWASAIRSSRVAVALLGQASATTAVEIEAVGAASVVSAAEVEAVGAAAAATTAEVGILRGALLGLTGLSPIGLTIAATLVLTRKDDLEKEVAGALSGVPGANTTGGGIVGKAIEDAFLSVLPGGAAFAYDYSANQKVVDHFKNQGKAMAASIREAQKEIQTSLDVLSQVTTTPAIRRSSLRAEFDQLVKAIQGETDFTAKRVRTLGARLAAAMGELAQAGFGPKREAQLKALALSLATTLAGAMKGVNSAALKTLREDRAQLGQEIADLNRRISDQIKQGSEQLAEAVRSANQAEHDAILGAKANLNQLGQTLAGQVTEFSEGASTKPTGPLARQLERLERLIHEGKATPALIRQAQKVESQLNAQQASQADKRARVGRSLADLTEEFNTGKISLAKFNREVTELLKREHVTYRSAGKSLGVAFADGFREALKELRAQAREIARTPAGLRRSVSGLEQDVISPREVIREQNRNISRIADQNAKELRETIRDRSKLQVKAAHDDAQIAKLTGTDIVAAIRAAARRDGRRREDAGETARRVAQGIVGAAEGVRDRTFQALRGDFKDSERVARGQRGTMIRQGRSQITHLSDLQAKTQTGNDLLRDIERTLRKQRGRNTNSRSAAETREAANQNLSL